MENKISHTEMEVDGAGTFIREGEMQCDGKSYQVSKENHQISSDNKDAFPDDLSESFMKLSVKDDASASQLPYYRSRPNFNNARVADRFQIDSSSKYVSTNSKRDPAIMCLLPGMHTFRKECVEVKCHEKSLVGSEIKGGSGDDCTVIRTTQVMTQWEIWGDSHKNLKISQPVPDEIITGKFNVEPSVTDVNVQVHKTESSSRFMPSDITALDKESQRQQIISNTLRLLGTKDENINEVKKHTSELKQLTPYRGGRATNLDHIQSPKEPSKLTLHLKMSPELEGYYENGLPGYSFLPFGQTNNDANLLPYESSSTQSQESHGINSLYPDSSSEQKEKEFEANSLSSSAKGYGNSKSSSTLEGNDCSSLHDKASLVNGCENQNNFRQYFEKEHALCKMDKDYDPSKYSDKSVGKRVQCHDKEIRNRYFEDSSEEKNAYGKWNPKLESLHNDRKVDNEYDSVKTLYRKDATSDNARVVDTGLGKQDRDLEHYKKSVNHSYCADRQHTDEEKILQKQIDTDEIREVKKITSSTKYDLPDEEIYVQDIILANEIDHISPREIKSLETRNDLEQEKCGRYIYETNKKLEPCLEFERNRKDKEERQSIEKLRNQKLSRSEKLSEESQPHYPSNDFHMRHKGNNSGDGDHHQYRRKSSSFRNISDEDDDECRGTDGLEATFDDVQDRCNLSTDFIYRKLSWELYLEEYRHDVGEWESDSMDPFEQTLSLCSFGDPSEKTFYREFDEYDHHDSGEIRGWNEGEFVFVGLFRTASVEREEGVPESSRNEHGELSPAGGAIRKTYCVNIERTEPKTWQRNVNDAESDLECGSSTESSKRRNDYCPPDLLTEDETESCAEQEDDVPSRMLASQQGSRYQEFLANSPTELSTMTEGSKSWDSNSLQPSAFVHYLTRCENFSCDIRVIVKMFSLYENVRNVIEDHPQIFRISGNVVELRPEISLCERYLSSEVCQERLSCSKLHICEAFLINMCADSECSYGHNLFTTHNKRVLETFGMNNLKDTTIIDVICLTLLGTVNAQPLEICNEYNLSSCKNANCKSLHICNDFIGGLGICVRPFCSLNHDLCHKNCRNILLSHGIDVTRHHEDETLLSVLQESFKITQLVQEYSSQGQTPNFTEHANQQQVSLNSGEWSKHKQNLDHSNITRPLQATSQQEFLPNSNKTTKHKKRSNSQHSFNTNNPSINSLNKASIGLGNSPSDSSKAFKSSERSSIDETEEKIIPSLLKSTIASIIPQSNKRKTKTKKAGIGFSTVWSSYACGDVEVDEICFHSVNSVCKFESSGCQRLHAPYEFHWQVKVSGNVSWINLQPHQVFHLERFYSDPYKEVIDFPPPNPKESPEIVHLVLKNDKYYANLKELKLVNSLTFDVFELRRLHMHMPDKDSRHKQFLWYVKDIADKWVMYGNVDSSGNPESASKVRSHQIEQKYQSGEAKFYFKNNKNTANYCLDFKSMVQVNMKTSSKREIRRRPKPHDT